MKPERAADGAADAAAAGAQRVRSARWQLLGVLALVLLVSAASSWWVGYQGRALGREVAALARPGDIHMVSSESCAICLQARRWFTQHRVAFSECLIERDPVCQQLLASTQSPGTPVMLVRGQPQLGFDPSRLKRALASDLR